MDSPSKFKYIPVIHIAILVVAVLIAYVHVFGAGFMSWDDADYVVNNADIRSWDNISLWFSKFYIGNYHPFTMVSYAIDYVIGEQQPFQYHLTNILLHIANSALLYGVLRRMQGNIWVAFFAALLFAIHPVQTESVSWVAERKNVLYGFFFLSSMLLYTIYLTEDRKIYLLWVFLTGGTAMLCKPAAVTLPFALLALDVWSHRSLKESKIWFSKLPLLVVAIVISILTMQAQKEAAFLGQHTEYQWYHTIIFAGYAYVQYIVHLLVPVNLSVLYPYPELGAVQILFSIIALAILALGFIAYRRKWFILCGGIIFYTVNIALVLQFVQFGEVLMADRYLYIPCIGIWLPIVYYLCSWLQKKSKETIAVAGLSVISLVFLSFTYTRNNIWLSERSFWEAIVETFPTSSVAQSSVGGVYMKQGNYAPALQHIDEAVRLDPNNYKAWYNKGVLHLRRNEFEAAAMALDKCISINEYSKALFSRALLYQQTQQPLRALNDIDKVLEAEPENARAHFIKGNCLEQNGSYEQAVISYTKAVEYGDGDPLFYLRRGIASIQLNRGNDAINDMSRVLENHPENAAAWYWRGIAKQQAGRECCHDLNKARHMGYKDAQAALIKYCNEY